MQSLRNGLVSILSSSHTVNRIFNSINWKQYIPFSVCKSRLAVGTMYKRICCEGQHVCCCFYYCSSASFHAIACSGFTQSYHVAQGISRSRYYFGVIAPVSLFFHLPFLPNCLQNFVCAHPPHCLLTTLLCNEELHNLYSSPSTIRMIKSRRMRWEGYVTRMRKRGMHVGYWWESQKEKYL
jgi:hypothetical protein